MWWICKQCKKKQQGQTPKEKETGICMYCRNADLFGVMPLPKPERVGHRGFVAMKGYGRGL